MNDLKEVNGRVGGRCEKAYLVIRGILLSGDWYYVFREIFSTGTRNVVTSRDMNS